MIKEILHADGTITPVPVPANGHVRQVEAKKETPRCRSIAPHEITGVLHDDRPEDLLWLDIEKPTDADLAFLGDTFGLDALALEDVQTQGQRPRVDDHGTFVHVVMYAIERDAEKVLRAHEIDLFYSDRYLIAVHLDPVPVLQEAVHRWQRNTEIIDSGIGALMYAVLDAIVDSYFPVLDAIEDDIEEVEERVFRMRADDRASDATNQFLFARRKDLLTLRRVVVPARDVTATISRRTLAHMEANIGPYIADVNDHIARAVDTIDTYRDLLDSTMDASLAVQSQRLNQTVKTMTASTIVLMGASLIAGIYGMNFANMPELAWTYGYPYALALMVLVAAILIYLFRRARWF